MNPRDFEEKLDSVVVALATGAQRGDDGYANSKEFENTVLNVFKTVLADCSEQAEEAFHVHAFPDLVVNGFGIEVKYTKKDVWLAVGNSIFEGMREPRAKQVYIIYGKMGGWPEVRWARYEDCVTHVRISHAPRFVVEMDGDGSKLFNIMGVPYEQFRILSSEEKMRHVREYSRNRLKEGERLWWLEDQEEPEHTLPMEVKLYMRLPRKEKIRLRAEGAILCPQIVLPSRSRGKYNDVALYLLTRYGVFCPQTRDLFSAGSVALRADETRGGNYTLRALQDIENEMRAAAERLEDKWFEEYWDAVVPKECRIREWLRRADNYAKTWVPSQHLFLNG